MSRNSTASDARSSRDLFPEPGPGFAGTGGRFVLALAVVVFFLIVSLTLVVDMVHPLDLPALAGDERDRDRERRQDSRWRNGSRARLIDDDLRLRSRVRQVLSGPYTRSLYHYFGEAQGSIMVGRSGWLFFGGRATLSPLPDELIARRIGSILSALERRLSGMGIRLVVAPIPRKSLFSREYLPRGVDARLAVDGLFIDDLLARGVDAVDLLPLFEADDGPLFYKHDTHWSRRAEYLAAREIIRSAGLLVPEGQRDGELRMRYRRPGGDLLVFIGIEGLWKDRELDAQPQTEFWEVFVDERRYVHENPPSMPPVALIGTSYSMRMMVELLSHFSQQTVWDAVRPATNSVATLWRFLLEHEDDSPEIILFEIPNHHAFAGDPAPAIGELFAAFPPAASLPITPPGALSVSSRFVAVTGVDVTPRRLVSLRPGALLHSGDGAVELRLRGVVEGEIDVEMRTAGYRYRAPWRAGQEELFLPLLDAGSATTLNVLVSSSDPGSSLMLRDAELVTTATVELKTGFPANVPEPPEGWCRVIRFPIPEGLPDYGVLWLEVARSGETSPLEVEVGGVGIDRSLQLSAELFADATIAINVSGLAGTRVLTADVCGKGASPKDMKLEGRLLTPGTSP